MSHHLYTKRNKTKEKVVVGPASVPKKVPAKPRRKAIRKKTAQTK